MKTRLIGSVAALLAGAGVALADPCGPAGCQGPVDTYHLRPITLYRQPQPPPPVPNPDVAFPNVKLYRAEIAPPACTRVGPPPPVEVFRRPPPQVQLFPGQPPQLPLFRQEVKPPEWAEVGPPPPVQLFRRVPEAPEWCPPVTRPNVTVWNQPQPPCPVPCKGPPGMQP
ncbi:MAG TPA: hypothetical protein VFA26_10410 [Gemmataceae bacterium]|nr:hypothetical protein [Gemmataceae bacterium]